MTIKTLIISLMGIFLTLHMTTDSLIAKNLLLPFYTIKDDMLLYGYIDRNGKIKIQCESFENESIIYPKPIIDNSTDLYKTNN